MSIALMVVAILVVIVAALLCFAATRPGEFRVERSAVMRAAPEKVFPLIADLHAWSGWSPWEKLDPGMKRSSARDGSTRVSWAMS